MSYEHERQWNPRPKRRMKGTGMDRPLYRVTAWIVSVTCVIVLAHVAVADYVAVAAYNAARTAVQSITESYNHGLPAGDAVSTVPFAGVPLGEAATDPATGNTWDANRMCWITANGACDLNAPVEHD